LVHKRIKKNDLKINITSIEDKARKIMLAEIEIWNKYGWKSGGEIEANPLKMKIYKRELKKTMNRTGIKKIPNFYYNIFEDANWHLMNSTLDDLGIFKNKQPFTKEDAEKDYKKYKSLGGKTWELT